jgi:hypothetical protein
MIWEEKQEKLQEIYDRFEKDVRSFKKNAVCRLGCTFCCTDVGDVDINTLEALTIRRNIHTFPRVQRKGIEKKLAANRKKKRKQSRVRCAFLAQHGACLIYDVRPFSCRQLYSLRTCSDTQGPMVHRQAVALAKKAVREMQQLDDNGYSGHMSFVLELLDDVHFRETYLSGGFDPGYIMHFGKSRSLVINRFMK